MKFFLAGIKIFLAGIKIFSAGIVIILAGIEIFSAGIKFFAFWTSAEALSGNRRAKMGPLWTPKISPIGLELIFFGWI